MEENKKFGRSKARATHLRRTKGNWTKSMANKKSRLKVKLDVKEGTPQFTPISTLNYTGYVGTVNYSPEDAVYYGQIANIRDVVTFEAKTLTGLRKAFIKCLLDYLNTCRKIGKEPDIAR